MKKALSILLAVCMLAVMCIVPVSAEMSPTQSLADVKASGADYLQLTHKNVKTYELEASPYPGDLTETEYKIGSKVYSHDDVCFTNVTKAGEDYDTQTPGSIVWDIEANKYNVFQCEFGKGSWTHSSGSAVQITVIAVYQDQELVIAQSPFVKMGDEPVRVAGLIPEHTTSIKIMTHAIDGNYGSCSSIIGEAVCYKAEEGYLPQVSVADAQIKFVKNVEGGTIYKFIDVPDFTTTDGMVFCYDVMIDADVPGLGGLNIHGYGDMRDVHYTDVEGNAQGGPYIGVLDQNGLSCHAVTDISDYAYNQWYTREFKLGDFLGTFTDLLVCQDTHVSDPALVSGAGTAYYKNICVKDADGNVVWSYTPTAADVAAATDLVATTNEYSMTSEATEGGFLYAPATGIQYFEVVQTEYVPSTTAPSTTVPTTDAPATGEGTDAPTTEAPKSQGGCGSMMGIGALVLAAVLAAPVAFKKH